MTESHHLRPAVSVATVVERDGRFLLVEEETRAGLRFNQPAGHLETGETPVQALHRIARSFLTHMLNETTLRNFRLIVAEAERTPQISRDFYDAGPRRGTDRLAAFLASLEADGILDLDGDPTSAASHFMGLVQSTTFKGRLCNAIPTLTPDQIAAEADRAVRVFLRAYGHAGGR